MSWLDLAALTLVLWSGVGGYLGGLRNAVIYLAGMLLSVLAAAMLAPSLVLYVNQEWQAEALLARYLVSRPGPPLSIVNPASDLYGLLWEAHFRLTPGLVLPVTARHDPATQVAGLLVWALSLAGLFLLGKTVVSVAQKSSAWRRGIRQFAPGGRKAVALIAGLCSGLLLAVIGCLLANALCLLPGAEVLWQDLRSSYLFSLSRAVFSGSWRYL